MIPCLNAMPIRMAVIWRSDSMHPDFYKCYRKITKNYTGNFLSFVLKTW